MVHDACDSDVISDLRGPTYIPHTFGDSLFSDIA